MLRNLILATAALFCLTGCPFTLTDVNTGVTAGRTFDDQSVFGPGKTVWGVNINGHFVRDKR